MCFVCSLMGISPIEYVEVSAGALKDSTVSVGWGGMYLAQIPPALVPLLNGYRLSPLFYN